MKATNASDEYRDVVDKNYPTGLIEQDCSWLNRLNEQIPGAANYIVTCIRLVKEYIAEDIRDGNR
jgi:hypothetical protein